VSVVFRDIESCYAKLDGYKGGLAQLVERVLSMHEVAGSIPASSRYLILFLTTTTFRAAMSDNKSADEFKECVHT
jgi:hypothetical protein